MNRVLAYLCASALAALAGCGNEPPSGSGTAVAAERMAPRFEVDPFWPKPLPNHWVIGSAIGVSVDSRDHVWIIHRQGSLNLQTEASAGTNTPTDACCAAAPPVLEFDAEGNLVGHWGGPAEGYDWPQSNHGITVDHMDNIWIGGNGENDAHLLKFTRAGQFLLQLGKPGANGGSNDTVNFGRVAKISIDAAANEAFVADGYGNKRVAVLDMDTGAFKRYWGAYGNRPDDTDLGPYDPAAALAGSESGGRAARTAIPQPRALRGADTRRLGLRLRPRQRPHSGVPQRRYIRPRAHGRAVDARRRLGLGHRVLEGPGAHLHLSRRRSQ